MSVALPDFSSLGPRPEPPLPRRTPQIASFRPNTGFELEGSQQLERSSQEFGSAARVLLQAQEQHDAVRIEDATNKLRQKQIDMTFGPDGFANLKGADAVNQPILKTYGAQFDREAADLSSGLDNDFQKRMFQKRAEVAGLQLREDIARHIVQQSNVYADDVFKSKLDTEIQVAASRWATPDAASVPILNIDNAIYDYARRNGKPQEWVDDTRAKAQSKVYDGVIRQAISSDPQMGRKMFDLYADKLTAVDRAQLDQTIQTRSYTQMLRENAEFERQERQAAKALRDTQTQNEANLLGDTLVHNPPSDAKLSTMVKTQQISAGGLGAVLALARRPEGMPDNQDAVIDLYRKKALGTLTIGDVDAAAHAHHLSIPTAAALYNAVGVAGDKADTAEAKGYFNTLRAAFQGSGVDQGFLKDRDSVDRWAGVQKEWIKQVVVDGKNPKDAFNDIVDRFQPPGHPPLSLDQPKMGSIINGSDVATVAQKTADAHAAGQISDEEYVDQQKIIVNYKRFFDQQSAAAQALRAARAGQTKDGGAKLKGAGGG